MKSDYKQTVIRAIKKAAGGTHPACHIFPRAYCVAKPAAWCAVFAVPPQDVETQCGHQEWIMVQDKTAAPCVAGGWYALAYVTTGGGSMGMQVIPNIKEESK